MLGVGGAVFEGSIQTPLVRAESGNDLRYIYKKKTVISVKFANQSVELC